MGEGFVAWVRSATKLDPKPGEFNRIRMYSSNIAPDIKRIIGSAIVTVDPWTKIQTHHSELHPGLEWFEIVRFEWDESGLVLFILGTLDDGNVYRYALEGDSDDAAVRARSQREFFDLVPDYFSVDGPLVSALIGRRCLIGFGQHPDGGMLVRQIETGSLSIHLIGDHTQGGASL